MEQFKTMLEHIKFDVCWIGDVALREKFFNHYCQMHPVLDCCRTRQRVQELADLNRDYYNHLYATTQYEYNPIENYAMVEQEDENINSNGVGSQYAENENRKIPISENDDSHSRGRRLTRRGNIGVTTSQQMIESERNIIIKITEMYLNIFSALFEV